MDRVTRRTVSNLFFEGNTVTLWGGHCEFWGEFCFWWWSEDNSLTFLRVLVLMVIRRQLKIYGFAGAFVDIFSIDSGPRRYFSIDTSLALDIFSNLWSTLLRPWHVADLLSFLYIEGKRGRICWNSFFFSGFPDVPSSQIN